MKGILLHCQPILDGGPLWGYEAWHTCDRLDPCETKTGFLVTSTSTQHFHHELISKWTNLAQLRHWKLNHGCAHIGSWNPVCMWYDTDQKALSIGLHMSNHPNSSLVSPSLFSPDLWYFQKFPQDCPNCVMIRKCDKGWASDLKHLLEMELGYCSQYHCCKPNLSQEVIQVLKFAQWFNCTVLSIPWSSIKSLVLAGVHDFWACDIEVQPRCWVWSVFWNELGPTSQQDTDFRREVTALHTIKNVPSRGPGL